MADLDPTERPQTQQLFVRADEVDAGTNIITPSQQLPLSALTPSDGSSAAGTARPRAPPRPGLRRDGSAPPPPPPSQPPPAPPGPPEVTDSLSLPQLRQLVGQFPKTEQRAYAFQYTEIDSYETEIDEWFQYTEAEQEREHLLAAREAFETAWKAFCSSDLDVGDVSWMEVNEDARLKFLSGFQGDLGDASIEIRTEGLGCLYYVLAGAWSITSGLDPSQCSDEFRRTQEISPEQYNAVQLEWMHRAADMILESGLVVPLYACLLTAAKISAVARDIEGDEQQTVGVFDDNETRELSLCFSCFYLLVESARERRQSEAAQKIRRALQALSPSFPIFLTSAISRLRWDELYNIPLIHAIQLLWKLTMLLFGDIQHDLEAVKAVLEPRSDPFSANAPHPKLTASPLDYHLFRQEITSKYPAYNPPLPLIPLETEQRTILPVLPQHATRAEAQPGSGASAINATTGTSILHQPVHIATPAPSPPPSPVGPGGKTGKKQNYQTNQNFPFLYPPLGPSSNELGGKGSTEIQDLMVGKKWEGSDIPASIIEAGELFASRMRMTRAMRQLWKQRDLFMKYDRGWRADDRGSKEELKEQMSKEAVEELEGLEDPDLRKRMEAVEHFFHFSLSDMQSFVIVLMKAMLANVQDIAVRNGNYSDPAQPTGLNRTKSNSNVGAGAQNLPMPPPPPKPADLTLEDLDNIRSREISQKAIAGVLFVLLKWLKMSHILKFEYLTQLLLDSNYVQLTLKYFAHQNLEDLVAFRYDRDDLSFFHYCHIHSDHPPLSPTSPDQHSDASDVDDAVPPPIQRHRRSPTSTSESATRPHAAANDRTTSDNASSQRSSDADADADPSHPTVDELGNPLAPLPSTPLPVFSSRQFQTSIHLLRTLQKITRAKAHRILLLVQFKSSQILRRVLRVPDTTLRLYVLKLFKSQVPYCGRKWRQSNMRVITAIYLHCRPELRDEWLAGMHDTSVEGEVEEAVPLEWAGRGLTHWWMKRRFADVMKGKVVEGEGAEEQEGGQEIEDEERDFFQRELDAMGWGLAGLGLVGMNGHGDEVAFGEEAPGVSGGGSAMGANGVPAQGSMETGWTNANASTLEAWQNER
ncbi:uncharacterized protein HMPREF1541_10319 [Cyphellophora europaea CBS 101466]|uniref:Far11/STRP C-terminal domain-containing protein n=1 Tax=Cyphellophora europaea (strain CBS 101466) TaxID=1220924 RepID=W2S9P9_CYPE1|nr:uncharacterized protein HMPREF1541_10319 [Cyphellophora europaea CBS 101466]ETN44649.1 hypothetical protein HMPREF1541_10319 [Cyphellophora europaea CBS 101466]